MDTLLSEKEVKLFYKLHPALLQYVNVQQNIFPNIKTPKELQNCGMKNVARVRDIFWKNHNKYIDAFISGNPYKFSKSELAIIDSWKQAVIGKFYVFRNLKKYSVFLTEEEPTKSYGVHSLNTPLEFMFPYPPVFVKAVLLPFQNHIIYDGILYPYSVTFGGGFKRNLDECYQESKKKFGIITQLIL